MIRKPLTCPTCGDTWKRVFNENFMRLGPPVHECRACWTSFDSGAKEWVDLDWSGRLAFFLQDLILLAPLALLLLVAIGGGDFFGLIDPAYAPEFLEYGGLALLGLFLLLTLWGVAMITLSMRRTRRPAARATARAASVAASASAAGEPEDDGPASNYPQGRPNPRPADPAEHRSWPL